MPARSVALFDEPCSAREILFPSTRARLLRTRVSRNVRAVTSLPYLRASFENSLVRPEIVRDLGLPLASTNRESCFHPPRILSIRDCRSISRAKPFRSLAATILRTSSRLTPATMAIWDWVIRVLDNSARLRAASTNAHRRRYSVWGASNPSRKRIVATLSRTRKTRASLPLGFEIRDLFGEAILAAS